MLEKVYKNPIVVQRADPLIYKHTDGYYYFTASVPEYDRIEIRRSKTLQGLSEAETFTAWTKHDKGEMSNLIWAPEIHFIKGKWYIYYAAAANGEVTGITFNHRMYVIENSNEDPLTDNWVEKGQVKQDGNHLPLMQLHLNIRTNFIMYGHKKKQKLNQNLIQIYTLLKWRTHGH